MSGRLRLLLFILLLHSAPWLVAQGTAEVGGRSRAAERRPFAQILKVGVVDVERGKRAFVEDESVDVMGAARDYRDRTFVALVQPRGRTRYLAAAVSAAEPGNIFTIGGVRFPARDCDLLVGVFETSSIKVGSWIPEEQVQKALAISERVPVTALRPVSVLEEPGGDGTEGADITITSIGNQSVSPADKVVTAVSSDVIARTQLLPAGSHVYLRIRVPYTNKCIVHKASKGAEAGTYIFRDMLFEAPGDPLVVHFSVMAFAGPLELSEGLIGCDTLPQDKVVTSPTIDVSVERKQGRVDLERVPFIAITRIGRQDIVRGVGAVPATVKQGDSIEVGAGERLPQGGVLTAWIRERGSHLWLVSPPMVPRGSSTQEGDGDVAVTWVLPAARFSSPDDGGQGATEYEVMAVLSTNALFPTTWLDSSALAAHSIETVSEIVPVRLRDPEPQFDFSLTMDTVCGQEVSDGASIQLRKGCPVVVGSRTTIPLFLHVIVTGHQVGDDSWTSVQAIRNGKTFTVPDFPMTGNGPDVRWQLVAIASPGALPATTMKYADFLPYLPQTSAVVLVDRSPEGGDHLDNERLESLVGHTGGAGDAERRPNSMFLLLTLLIIVALLTLIEWQFGGVSEVAGWAADRLRQDLDRVDEQLEIPSKIKVGPFLLGVAILGFLSWLIVTQYLRLYTEVLAAVANLSLRDSRGWATYLVVMTGLAGVLIDVSHRIAGAKHDPEDPGLLHAINAILFFGAFVLWSFSGALYFEFLRRNSGGLVPPIGATAAFLLALIESLGFFFGTHLALDELGWLVVRAALLPLRILVMVLGLTQKIFDRRRQIYKQSGPATNQPPSAAPIPSAAAGD